MPILAHPERLEYFQENLNLLGRLVRLGALVQITADSLIDGFRAAQLGSTSQLMLEHDLVHFLASDAHDSHYRIPGLAEARDAAADIVGVEAAEALVQEHPAAVIHNQEIPVAEPQSYAPPRRWLW